MTPASVSGTKKTAKKPDPAVCRTCRCVLNITEKTKNPKQDLPCSGFYLTIVFGLFIFALFCGKQFLFSHSMKLFLTGRTRHRSVCRLLDNYIAAKMRNRAEILDLVLPEIQHSELIEAAESRDVPNRIASELQFFQIGQIPEG